MRVILEIKVLLVRIKKDICQCHPPCTMRVNSHRVLHLQFLGSYNICITYLHVLEACLKDMIAMFYFSYSKNPSKNF